MLAINLVAARRHTIFKNRIYFPSLRFRLKAIGLLGNNELVFVYAKSTKFTF